MAIKVVDASALAALLFGEEAAELIAGQLEGTVLVAPALLLFELGNVCLMKRRRFPAKSDQLLAGLRDLSKLRIRYAEVDPVEAHATR